MRTTEYIFLLMLVGTNICCSQRSGTDQKNTIVLVNTGYLDKQNIAQEIDILNRFNAKVIALDIAFTDYAGDKTDNDLIAAIEQKRNVVLPTTIHNSGKDYYGKDMIDVVSTCALPVVPIFVKEGFVSAESEDKNGTQIPRKFLAWQRGYGGDIYYHFSIVTAMAYDSVRAVRFVKNHPQMVDLDFSDWDRDFKVVSGLDLRNGKVSRGDIEGNIIIMGFLGPGETDKFISPLSTRNNKLDMYGMEYLARIVEQVLSD